MDHLFAHPKTTQTVGPSFHWGAAARTRARAALKARLQRDLLTQSRFLKRLLSAHSIHSNRGVKRLKWVVEQPRTALGKVVAGSARPRTCPSDPVSVASAGIGATGRAGCESGHTHRVCSRSNFPRKLLLATGITATGAGTSPSGSQEALRAYSAFVSEEGMSWRTVPCQVGLPIC